MVSVMYRLYVQNDGQWLMMATLDARTHDEAFRQALGTLRPEHRDSPIRLERVQPDTPLPPPLWGRDVSQQFTFGLDVPGVS